MHHSNGSPLVRPILVPLLLAFVALSAPHLASADRDPGAKTPKTAPYSLDGYAGILEGFVTADGRVRYAALHGDEAARARLSAFVETIAGADPSGWSRDERLAFFINAYNALVLQAVIERWPVQSVQRVPGFFDRLRFRVAGRSLTLNGLENDIIRGDEFSEPRIHFAVNCASVGCPPLAREPYRAANLERLLDRQTRAFIRRTSRTSGESLQVTRLFDWFATDFGGPEGVRRFLARYLTGEARELAQNPSAEIRFFPYNWAINRRD